MRLTAQTLLLSLGLLTCSSPSAGEESDWIYNVFVAKCREAGGVAVTTIEEYRSGQEFKCDSGGSGRSSNSEAPSTECEGEAKINVDWVFADKGAFRRFTNARDQGASAFESVISAQDHNPGVQALLRRCASWVEGYLADKGAGGPAEARNERRQLRQDDCRCISVVPMAASGQRAGPAFRVSNSCDRMTVKVRFIGDILNLTARDAFSSWANAGPLAAGEASIVSAPDWKFVSIRAVGLSNGSSSFTCNF